MSIALPTQDTDSTARVGANLQAWNEKSTKAMMRAPFMMASLTSQAVAARAGAWSMGAQSEAETH